MIGAVLWLVAAALGQPTIVAKPLDLWSYCANTVIRNCSRTWAPVCGVTLVGVPKTYANNCTACNHFDVVSFRSGVCENIASPCVKSGCSPSVPGPAQKEACAFQPEKRYQEVNSDICCLVPELPYVALIAGKCPEVGARPSIPGLVRCRGLDKNKPCTRGLHWVCGYTHDSLTKATYINECQACSDPDISGFALGKCSGNVPSPRAPDPEDKYYYYCPGGLSAERCSIFAYDPVCAVPYVGLPTGFQQPCGLCNLGKYLAFRKGKCSSQVKICPKPRVDCTYMNAVIPACGFQKGSKPYDVLEDMCCTTSRF